MPIIRRTINGLNLITFYDPSDPMTYDHYIDDLMIYNHYTSDLMTYDLKYLIELYDSTSFY
jgi:hypothetical protein